MGFLIMLYLNKMKATILRFMHTNYNPQNSNLNCKSCKRKERVIPVNGCQIQMPLQMEREAPTHNLIKEVFL